MISIHALAEECDTLAMKLYNMIPMGDSTNIHDNLNQVKFSVTNNI